MGNTFSDRFSEGPNGTSSYAIVIEDPDDTYIPFESYFKYTVGLIISAKMSYIIIFYLLVGAAILFKKFLMGDPLVITDAKDDEGSEEEEDLDVD